MMPLSKWHHRARWGSMEEMEEQGKTKVFRDEFYLGKRGKSRLRPKLLAWEPSWMTCKQWVKMGLRTQGSAKRSTLLWLLTKQTSVNFMYQLILKQRRTRPPLSEAWNPREGGDIIKELYPGFPPKWSGFPRVPKCQGHFFKNANPFLFLLEPNATKGACCSPLQFFCKSKCIQDQNLPSMGSYSLVTLSGTECCQGLNTNHVPPRVSHTEVFTLIRKVLKLDPWRGISGGQNQRVGSQSEGIGALEWEASGAYILMLSISTKRRSREGIRKCTI